MSADREFGRRRMKNAIGLHVSLRCLDWQVEAVLEGHLAEVVDLLRTRSDLTIRISVDGLAGSSAWS